MEQSFNVGGETKVENLHEKAHCHGEMTSTNMTMLQNLFFFVKLHINGKIIA